MSAALRQKVDREPRVSAGHRRDWQEFAGRSCDDAPLAINRKHRCEFKVTADPVSFLRPVGDLQP